MSGMQSIGIYGQGQRTSEHWGYEPESCGWSGLPQNVSEMERWGSLATGAALLLSGLGRGRLSGLLMTVTGGALLYRGMTGHCHLYEALGIDTTEHRGGTAVAAQEGFKFETSIVVHRSADELYRFWRDVSNLPRVMRHLKVVRVTGERTSHWIADGLMGRDVEWDAEIHKERVNEMIAWRSLPGGDVDTAGSVHFDSAGPGLGTTVTVALKYNPPGGKLGAGLAWLLSSGAEQKIEEDLRQFKQFMEVGGGVASL